MRKIIQLICFASLCILSACKGEKKAEEPERFKPDLAFYGVKGPVHELTDINNEIKYVFDEEGNLLTIDGRNPFNEELLREYDEETGIMIEHPRLNRDSLGQIAEQFTLEGEIVYIWDNGHVIAETGVEESTEWSCSYEYDAEGRLIKHTVKIWSVDQEPKDGETFTDQYTYSTFDQYGNWLTRMNGEETESRSITYYESTKP